MHPYAILIARNQADLPITGWWFEPLWLKNISQLGWLFPIYGKIKHVPNHQPVIQSCLVTHLLQRALDEATALNWYVMLKPSRCSQEAEKLERHCTELDHRRQNTPAVHSGKCPGTNAATINGLVSGKIYRKPWSQPSNMGVSCEFPSIHFCETTYLCMCQTLAPRLWTKNWGGIVVLVVLWPMEKEHLKPAVDIGNEKWRPMKLRLKRKSMESVEKDFPAFSFHWKTLEINGKRSHVCHARSANLLSAADDAGYVRQYLEPNGRTTSNIQANKPWPQFTN